MKPVFLIILLMSYFIASAQVKKDSSTDVIYYVDSVRVSSLSAVSPDDISGMLIIRTIDSVNKIKGKVYISSKNHSSRFISIEELTNRAIESLDHKAQPVIYFVDDKLVTDTADMKFEIFAHIWDVEVINGSQIKAFNGLLSRVIIVKIKPGNATISIKGNSIPTSFEQ